MESAQIRNSAGNSYGSHQPNHTAGVDRLATGAGNAWYCNRVITSLEGLLKHNSDHFHQIKLAIVLQCVSCKYIIAIGDI